jgi:hypothetical protein
MTQNLKRIIFSTICLAAFAVLALGSSESGNKSSTSTTDSQISDCERAKAEFRACERLSGDSYVNCLARINAPEGCGDVSTQHLLDKAKQR